MRIGVAKWQMSGPCSQCEGTLITKHCLRIVIWQVSSGRILCGLLGALPFIIEKDEGLPGREQVK